ncbi:DEAD/DEAH box helicase, partial [Aerococcus sp. L_4]
TEDVTNEREEALAKQLDKLRTKKKRLVDPIQFEMQIQDKDLQNYVPMFGQELDPPTKEQLTQIEKAGIDPTSIDSKGKADELLKRVNYRNQQDLSTPKQIRQLEQRGYQNVANWKFDQAKVLIDQIAANKWRSIHSKAQAETYQPS